jgi:hypothetical protein
MSTKVKLLRGSLVERGAPARGRDSRESRAVVKGRAVARVTRVARSRGSRGLRTPLPASGRWGARPFSSVIVRAFPRNRSRLGFSVWSASSRQWPDHAAGVFASTGNFRRPLSAQG